MSYKVVSLVRWLFESFWWPSCRNSTSRVPKGCNGSTLAVCQQILGGFPIPICHAVSRQISPWILFVWPNLTTRVKIMRGVLSTKGENLWIYQSGFYGRAADPHVVQREDHTRWDQLVSTHLPAKNADSAGCRGTRKSLELGGLHGEGMCCNKTGKKKKVFLPFRAAT